MPHSPEPASWYCVQTAPSQEQTANANLTAIGYDTLFLHYTKDIRRSRRVETVTKPYIPGYVFVAVPENMGFDGVRGAHGVQRILRGCNGPQKLQDSEIARMRSLAGENGYVGHTGAGGPQRARYAVGEELRIIEGPLTGYDGPVVIDRGGEIVLELAVLGGATQVIVFPWCVSPKLRSVV